MFLEPRIYTYYRSVVCQDLIYSRRLKNIMELPEIGRCILNSSSADFLQDVSRQLAAQVALERVAGQKSSPTRSRKSIAAFQLRKAALLGSRINLRGMALYSFLDQYILLVCPGLRKGYQLGREFSQSQSAARAGLGEKARKNKGVTISSTALYSNHDLRKGLRGEKTEYNFAGSSFALFPDALHSFAGGTEKKEGYNCTLGAARSGQRYFRWLLAALAFPL